MRNAGITVEERRFQRRVPAAFDIYAAMKWPLFHGDTLMLGLIQADEMGK